MHWKRCGTSNTPVLGADEHVEYDFNEEVLANEEHGGYVELIS